jgi:hypothetical protein
VFKKGPSHEGTRGVKVQLHVFLTLDTDEVTASRTSRFTAKVVKQERKEAEEEERERKEKK